MINRIDKVTVLIRDEDDALTFYTDKLGFEKRMDVTLPAGARWLSVAPRGSAGPELVLHNPLRWHDHETSHRMLALVGQGPGMVVTTENCRQTCAELARNGVTITVPPAERPYGVEAVFADLYGNSFVLVEPRS